MEIRLNVFCRSTIPKKQFIIITVNDTQYHQMESLEVNPVTRDIGANVLGKTVSTAFTLIGHEITPDDLHAYHRLKNKDRVILKSKKLKKLN